MQSVVPNTKSLFSQVPQLFFHKTGQRGLFCCGLDPKKFIFPHRICLLCLCHWWWTPGLLLKRKDQWEDWPRAVFLTPYLTYSIGRSSLFPFSPQGMLSFTHESRSQLNHPLVGLVLHRLSFSYVSRRLLCGRGPIFSLWLYPARSVESYLKAALSSLSYDRW